MVNLPADFVTETRRMMGDERFRCFLGAFDEEVPTSIRVNPSRGFSHRLDSSPSHLENVPWCEEGYYLQDRPQFTFDPLFHAGCYYVQEASSMFVTHVLRSLFHLLTFSSHTALDMCAAPGGKSTALLSVLPDSCTLISNEPIANRAQILLENITKWGAANCIVTNNYPRDFRKAKLKFDLILCDVPCSGEGMFRKDPATISEWSPQNVEKCWRLQREIVSDAWECLNPGGLFIYSTCTFNTKENEENIQWILDNLDAEVLDIPIDPSWNITGSLLEGFTHPVYRFIPGISRGEGLFACALRKNGVTKDTILSPQVGGNQRGLSKGILNSLEKLSVLRPPLPPPTQEGKQEREPTQEGYIEVSYQEALKYLRGEALVLPSETPRGIVNITYKGQVIGPAKNIGSRANNLYPKAWRIKTTHLPTEEIKIIDI